MQKAGIPERDARVKSPAIGQRATIASQLYNAREPLDILSYRNGWGILHLNLPDIMSKLHRRGWQDHWIKLVTLNVIAAWFQFSLIKTR